MPRKPKNTFISIIRGQEPFFKRLQMELDSFDDTYLCSLIQELKRLYFARVHMPFRFLEATKITRLSSHGLRW